MSNEEILARAKAGIGPSTQLVDIDYRDELPADILQECIKNESLDPLYEPDFYRDALNEGAAFMAAELIGSLGLTSGEMDAFKESEAYNDLIDEILIRAESPEKKLFTMGSHYGYLRLQSNYDLWCPLRMTGGLNTVDDALMGILSVLSLNPAKVRDTAREMGVKTAPGSRWPHLPLREGKEVVDYRDFVKCLANTPGGGSWTFVGTFDMKALLENGCRTETMTIPKGTTCLIFDPFLGGGSYEPIATIRPLAVGDIIKRQKRYKDTFHIIVDEGRETSEGYSTGSVYGEHLDSDVFLTR